MPEPLVRIRAASLFIPGQLPRRLILKNIDWTIWPGRHCALMGPNGSGKSSLLKFIHGDLWPESGGIVWYFQKRPETSPIAGRQLTGLVSPDIQAGLQIRGWNETAFDFLAEAPDFQTLAPDAGSGDRIFALMEELDSAALLDKTLPELSQGQMRLLLIARELLREPGLLLLDEWEDGLDSRRHELVAEAFARRAGRMTFIFATHKPALLPAWVAERRYMLEGRLLETQPEMNAVAVDAPIFGGHEKNGKGKPVYELENVSVYIDRQPVLKDINWRARQGENWLIAGPNGSGKSTFLRLLAGDEFVYAGGTLRHWSPKLGRQAASLEEKRRSASLVSDLGQALYAYELSALELVLSGYENSVGVYREFSGSEIEWARELLAVFFPENHAFIPDQSIRRLSTGQLRRLHLARALAARPDILLLDEPYSGLDQQSRASLRMLLTRLASGALAELRPQIIMVTHQLEEAPDCIDRYANIANGRLTLGQKD